MNFTPNGSETPMVSFALALALGLIIGIQRGWKDRDQVAGGRIAGVRTHALVALLGAVSTYAAQAFSEIILGLAFLGITIVAVNAYSLRLKHIADFSITGVIGLLLTFWFGALVMLGQLALAASATVITAILLDSKEEIHGLIRQLRENELDAGLKLLLISVVMLPLLPNEAIGPGKLINPYEVWWMVVLIASISFAGYFAVKFGGTEKGLLFTSLFAGLSSSTVLTLHFSRLAKANPSLSPLLGAGILAACGTMFPRILLVCSVIDQTLFGMLFAPLAFATAALYVPAGILWMKHRHVVVDQPELNQNPLDLKSAISFGLMLVGIMAMAKILSDWMGESGVLLLAAASGIADVDAITLSLARMGGEQIAMNIAALGILIAAASNSLVKTSITGVAGSLHLTRFVAPYMIAALAVGLLTLLL